MSHFQLEHFRLPSGFRGASALKVQMWWLVQETLFRWSPQWAYGFRNWLAKIFGARIGRGVLLRPSCKITYPWKVSIGEFSWIGDNVTLYSLGDIQIGKNTIVSQNSYICAATHDYTKSTFDILDLPVKIGNSVWLASDVFIAPGITICDTTIISLRSTVTKDIRESGV